LDLLHAGFRIIYEIERATVYVGKIYVNVRAANGSISTLVVTPEFNYLSTGKMTTSIPAATLQDIESGFWLDPNYISQHRSEYSCVAAGVELIGNVETAKLKVKSPDVEGELNADQDTGRLLRTSYQNADLGRVVIDFSDWRTVDGVLVASKRRVINSNATTELTLGEYQLNPALEIAWFAPPPGQIEAALTLKVLQAQSVPYTVQTNGGISTACNISGSTTTSMTATTYGNTTFGSATSTPNLQMNCKSSDTTIRWTHVLNAMFVQASDGNSYIIACDRAWAWSKCTPLRAGDTFLAKRSDKGFVVQSIHNSKEKEATYSILQSKSMHE
jgi:hypothetical protein